MLELPKHIRRLRIVSADQVALVMAEVSPEVSTTEEAREGNYAGWIDAVYYKQVIFQTICLREILPYKACVALAFYYDGSPDDRTVIDNNKINKDTMIVYAEFLAVDIWPWAEKEFGNDTPWFSEIKNKRNDVAEDKELREWGGFAGKDTALKMIAGMAIALEASGGKFVRGGKLNKLEVARTASRNIRDYGEGIDVTEKALTLLLDEALRKYASR